MASNAERTRAARENQLDREHFKARAEQLADELDAQAEKLTEKRRELEEAERQRARAEEKRAKAEELLRRATAGEVDLEAAEKTTRIRDAAELMLRRCMEAETSDDVLAACADLRETLDATK